MFLHCRNCDSLAVVVVVHFEPNLAGRNVAAIGRAYDCFCGFVALICHKHSPKQISV